MKLCNTCGVNPPAKNRTICHSCRRKKYPHLTSAEYYADRRKDLKTELVEYAGGCCKLCGYNKCIQALEFHHLDPSQKDITISSNLKRLKSLQAEIDKCILVCANCHREIHAGVVTI